MNIKKIIREEMDEWGWVKESDPFDLLDNHFGIINTANGFKFIDYDYDPKMKKDLPRFIFPWSWSTDKTLIQIAYEPAIKFHEIYKLSKNDLYKIVHNKGIYNMNYFKNKKIANELNEWKSSRTEGLKNYYPYMWSYYKHEYL
jgi:hypothetical protein